MGAANPTIAERAEEQLQAMRRAFGAPGDHGYGTKEGDALLGLYRFLADIQSTETTA